MIGVPCGKSESLPVFVLYAQLDLVKIYIDYLLTECEVCTEKYLPEVCAKEPEGKYFSVQTEQTKLIRNLLYGFWLFSSSLLTELCVRELTA